jgi:hypothetical protein
MIYENQKQDTLHTTSLFNLLANERLQSAMNNDWMCWPIAWP